MENVTGTQEEPVIYTQLVIASKWQSPRFGDEPFKKENSKLLRKDKAIPRAFTDRVNNSFKSTGLYFKLDEDKTKAFYELKDQNVIKVAEAKKIQDAAMNVAASAIGIAAAQSAPQPQLAIEVETKPKSKQGNNGKSN